jgi:outer membrane receptor protein involved in Fe transport
MKSLVSTTRGRFALLAGVAVGAVSLSTPALAQDANEDTDPLGPVTVAESTTEADGSQQDDGGIVVTGSRIARPNYDTVEPSVVVSAEQIEARGFETLGQALNEQPSFGVPGSSPVGAQSGFGQGQSFVNFLGLGSQRTLTLVNSKRFVSSNTASIFGPTGAGSQVDLNVVPTKLVERIETIAVGGAPIYGADAISGTINVILKSDFEGIEVDGQYGISSRGDASNYRFRALAGTNFAGGRGNITVAGEYNKGDGLVFNDRDILVPGNFFRNASDPNSGFLQELYEDRRIPSISATGSPIVGLADFGLDFNFPDDQGPLFGLPAGFNGAVSDADGNQLKFDVNGNLIPIDFGQYAGAPGSFGIDFAGGNGFSLNDVSNLLSPTERYSAIAIGSYDVTDNVRFYAEAWYSRSKGTNLTDQPVYNSALFDAAGTPDGNIIVSIDNPFLTPEARAAIQNAIDTNPFSDQNFNGVNQDYFYLGRANTDLQSGFSTGEVEVMRFVAGLDGTFEIGENEWNWDIFGNYGRSETNSRSRELIQQNFENAVDAVLDANGNIVCRAGVVNASIPSINPNCTPINLFGTGRNSQEALDYVTAIATPRSLNKLYDFVASVGGPVFALPGGDFSVAFGYEHREESQDFDPGAFFLGELQPDGSRSSFGRSVPIQPVFGKFNTDEVFGEFLAELVSPSTGIFLDLLEVKGAARYVDNSIAGGDWTWTLGGRVGIFGVTFRGNYTQSIRAPAITEAFNPSSDFFGFAVDPCDSTNIGNGPDPATRAANCAADGITQPFSSLSNSRSFNQAVAGNPNLLNEKADSWTVGAVIAPSFIPRLRISVDYVDIKLRDVISELGASQIVANCYDSPDFPTSEFCDRISRDGANQLDFIETGYFNSAELRYKGVLGSLEYRIPDVFGDGELGFQASYQYLDTLSSRADANSAPGESAGEIGYSKHQGVFTTAYSTEEFGVFAQASYIGKAKINVQAADNFYPDGLNNLDSKIFVNLGANWNVTDKFEFRLVVDNVFDTKPPFPFPASGGTISYFRGVLGTYYRVGATVKF